MRHVDVDAVELGAFGLAEDHPPFASASHAHTKHQILFAASGTLVLTSDDGRWTLPPQRAAWIPAKKKHRVESRTGIGLQTVYIASAWAAAPPATCRVFAVTPLAREMFAYASTRLGASVRSPAREPFFRTLALLAVEWLAADRPYHLPVAKSEALARAMRFVDTHLADATVERAAAVAHVSVRTLARRFEEEARMSFRAYLQSARMMRAMELLAEPRASVSATAYAVGFASLGAFTTAFTERCGETPSAYRARIGPPRARRPRRA